MIKKIVLVLSLMTSPVLAQSSAGQSVIGFYLAPGQTSGSFTCPGSSIGPCFVPYGATIPTSGGGAGSDVNIANVAGSSVATGHGTAAGTLRVELPTDGTGKVGLNAGTAVIGHVITDSTSTTAVTQATASNLNATVIGTGTFAVQPTVAVNALGLTPTDRTVTSATGSSQTVMAANASRHSLLIQNTGTANCGVNPTGGTAVIGGAGTLTLIPQASYSPRVPTVSAVTAICTAAQPLYANEN